MQAMRRPLAVCSKSPAVGQHKHAGNALAVTDFLSTNHCCLRRSSRSGMCLPTSVRSVPRTLLAHLKENRRWTIYISDNHARGHTAGMIMFAKSSRDAHFPPKIIENFSNESESEPYADPEDSELTAQAKRDVPEPSEFSYEERDVILYNLGIGATEKELQWTYEGHSEFAALPTFGVIPQFNSSSGISLDWIPGFNPVRKRFLNSVPSLTFVSFRRSCCMVNNT